MLSSQLFPGQTWSNYHRLHSCCGGLWEHVSTSFPLVQLAVCRVEVCAAQPLPTALETVGDWSFGWPIAVIPLLENKNLRLRLLRTRENRNNARAVTYSLKYIEIYNYYIYREREISSNYTSITVLWYHRTHQDPWVSRRARSVRPAGNFEDSRQPQRQRFFRVAVLLTRRQEIIISIAPRWCLLVCELF